METIKNNFVSLEALAAELSLPKAYLKQLAIKDLIPYLNVNRRLRFDIMAVRQALADIAAKGGNNE